MPVSLSGMGPITGTGTGQELGEVPGSKHSSTMTPMTPVGAFIDPMRSVTGSTTLSAVESGPGSGVNQVQGLGFGSGTGKGKGIEAGQKQGCTDKELSAQSFGSFAKSLNTLLPNIILRTLPYSTPFNPFQPISFN